MCFMQAWIQEFPLTNCFQRFSYFDLDYNLQIGKKKLLQAVSNVLLLEKKTLFKSRNTMNTK